MRWVLALMTAAGLLLLSAVPMFAASGDPGKVTITSHACTEQPIKTQADFDAVVARAEGDAVTALTLTGLACPTIVLSVNDKDRTGGVAGPAVDFDVEVTDSTGAKQTLADAVFTPAKLCETDLERDVNGDGNMTADVCLDVSNYTFSNLAVGTVTVKETTPPNGWKFGTLSLIPKVLQIAGSDDSKTGVDFSAKTATVRLNLAGDADEQALLHVFLFANSPATDTLPAASDGSAVPLLPIMAGLLGLFGVVYALRRRVA